MSADETVGPPLIAGLRYKALLGSGGFADVYRYEQTALGRDVAVKVIHGFDDAARRHFASEASLMARLSSHPHVVPVYQVGESDDRRPYLVMQLCPGPNLADRMRARPLPVPEVLQIGIQVAGAVETAHRLGILHRDIKPANILFNEYGRPLLADFGISQSLEATAQPLPAFSPAWAPPEQTIGQGLAPTADVYSICATLWAALTGKAPLGSHRPGVAEQEMGRTDVPVELADILRAGLAEEITRRPPSALELGRALQRVQAQQGLGVTPIELWDGTDRDQPRGEHPDDRTHLVTLVEPEAGVTAPAQAPLDPPLTPAPTTPAPDPSSSPGGSSALGGNAAPVAAATPSAWPPAAAQQPYPAYLSPAETRENPRRGWIWLLLILLTLLALLVLGLVRFLPQVGSGGTTPTPAASSVSSTPSQARSPEATNSQPTSTAPTSDGTSAGQAESSKEAELGTGGWGG